MADETQKVWKVLLGVEASKLEEVLNAHVDEGLQAYRMDRYDEKEGDINNPWVVKYDVVLFNPMLLGERASKKFTDAVMAQMGPLSGPPSSG